MIRLSPNAVLYHADMRDALKLLPDNSVDSVVCDPPYHLTSVVKRFGGANAAPAQHGTDGAFARASCGFMQKNWDGGDIAFQPATWAQVLRVLKPGGYCAAFGAPRNFGRLQVAMFEAGFEERDTILNNLDTESPITMFLDSLNDAQRDAFMKCMDQSELTGMLSWKFGTGFPKGQNVPKFIDRELGVEGSLGDPKSERHAGWIKTGTMRGDDNEEGWQRPWMDDPEAVANAARQYIPASPEAIKYTGFSTALKPAFEPIVLARKPLSEGTVAANVLRWGTGALNIGGCRVGNEVLPAQMAGQAKLGTFEREDMLTPERVGRWPANVVHDGSDEVVGAFPNSNGSGNARTLKRGRRQDGDGWGMQDAPGKLRDAGNGSAARFFYSAKASRADRAGSKHPTVKPIALMQWLARLITPPGGTVLDPFAGSGTTGAACEREGFRCVLVEREDEYVEDIRNRFGAAPCPITRILAWNAAVASYKSKVAA